MPEELPVRRVEVSFVGTAPTRQVGARPGSATVEIDGSILRCLVSGSFQPFLEALRGHEVIGFDVDDAPGRPSCTVPPNGRAAVPRFFAAIGRFAVRFRWVVVAAWVAAAVLAQHSFRR